MFKINPFIIAALIFLTSASPSTYINPTGTYKLESKNYKKNAETYGYTGVMQVKRITQNKIAITFGVNKGAPSYNSGAIIDTLDYLNNNAVYFDPSVDSTCRITFNFTTHGVSVVQVAGNINNACGFGHGVTANGYFKKISSLSPVLKNPQTDEIVNKN